MIVIPMAGKKIVKSPDTTRVERVPPGQRLTESWPVLHYGEVPKIDLSKWSLRIFGLVDKEVKLSHREFLLLPRTKVFSDVHCVTGWSRLENTWEGVSAAELKKLTKILPKAKFAIVHAEMGFTANLPLKEFFEPDVVFADRHNDRPIPPDHGYPVRLVVPRLYFWKSAKWVTGVEFTAEDRPGFWETRGYHNHGDPWTEERYS